MKVLIWGHWGIGDHISVTLPLARTLKQQGFVTHGVFHNLSAYRLMRETNCFDVSIMLPDYYANDYKDEKYMSEVFSDVVKMFPRYDRVYATSMAVYWHLTQKVKPALRTNLVEQIYPEDEPTTLSRTPFKLGQVSLKGNEKDILIDISIYRRYFADFNCRENSVLLNSTAKGRFKTYLKHNEVKTLLTSKGFDVREFDYNDDIRKNMHLVNQVRHILTTDSAPYWMGKALEKTPHVYLSEGRGYFGPRMETELGTKNIVKWYRDINEIPPQEIVDGFVRCL